VRLAFEERSRCAGRPCQVSREEPEERERRRDIRDKTSREMCSRRINIIDISMERCSRFTSAGTPSIRRVRNSRRRDVAKRPSSVSEFTCCYATSSRVLYVGTSTRFHRTVIDRGRPLRIATKSTLRDQARNRTRRARCFFRVLLVPSRCLALECEPNPLDHFAYFSDRDETETVRCSK